MYSCFIYFGAGPDQHKKPVNLACTAALFILVLAQTSTKSPSVWHVQLLCFFWCWLRPAQKARQSGMYSCFLFIFWCWLRPVQNAHQPGLYSCVYSWPVQLPVMHPLCKPIVTPLYTHAHTQSCVLQMTDGTAWWSMLTDSTAWCMVVISKALDLQMSLPCMSVIGP